MHAVKILPLPSSHPEKLKKQFSRLLESAQALDRNSQRHLKTKHFDIYCIGNSSRSEHNKRLHNAQFINHTGRTIAEHEHSTQPIPSLAFRLSHKTICSTCFQFMFFHPTHFFTSTDIGTMMPTICVWANFSAFYADCRNCFVVLRKIFSMILIFISGIEMKIVFIIRTNIPKWFYEREEDFRQGIDWIWA